MNRRESMASKVAAAALKVMHDKSNSKAAKTAAGLSLAQRYRGRPSRAFATAAKVERPRDDLAAQSG